jgi:uncharacterized membrane protein YecN with MAPEG domain
MSRDTTFAVLRGWLLAAMFLVLVVCGNQTTYVAHGDGPGARLLLLVKAVRVAPRLG